jgi:hypothetical protein
MNATVPARLRIVGSNTRTTSVSPWGFRMEVEYEYDPGEAPIYWPTDRAHPGSPPNAALMACRINGQDVMDMLTSGQIERLEDAILQEDE